MTPEGRTKAVVTALLLSNNLTPASKAGAVDELCRGWFFMPVPAGRGVSGIPDYIGFIRRPSGLSEFFAVETKAPGKKPTGFQKLQIEAIRASGGTVFVVDGDVTELEAWLRGE